MELPQPETASIYSILAMKNSYFAYLISFLICTNLWQYHHVIYNHVEKIDSKNTLLDKITLISEPYRQGKDSPIRIAMRDSLNALQVKYDLYIDNSGNVYTRNK